MTGGAMGGAMRGSALGETAVGGEPACGPTILRTFAWPRSSEWNARAETTVAAALPTATPMIVPPTPRNDRAKAAMVAPATEATTCLTLSFTPPSRSHERRAEAPLELRDAPRPLVPRLAAPLRAEERHRAVGQRVG